MSVNIAPWTGIPDDRFRDLYAVWDQLRGQLTPFNTVITFEGSLFRGLNNYEADWFRRQFMGIIKQEALYVQDYLIDRVFLGPEDVFRGLCCKEADGSLSLLDPATIVARNINGVQTASQSGDNGVDKKDAKSTKVPRPSNAFILYRVDLHPVIKAANPGIHNNMISKIIGAQWNMESAEVIEKYTNKAAEKKVEHAAKYPGYQYQPRRRGERKVRAQKKPIDGYVIPTAITTMTGGHDVPRVGSLPLTQGDIDLLVFQNNQVIAAGGPVTAPSLPVFLEPLNGSQVDPDVNANSTIPWDAIRIAHQAKCINPAFLLSQV